MRRVAKATRRPCGRNVSERRAGLETGDGQADPAAIRGRLAFSSRHNSSGSIGLERVASRVEPSERQTALFPRARASATHPTLLGVHDAIRALGVQRTAAPGRQQARHRRGLPGQEIDLCAGDRIRWTRNDAGLGLVNSHAAEIRSVEGERVSFRLEDGRMLALGKDAPQLRHLEPCLGLDRSCLPRAHRGQRDCRDGGESPPSHDAEELLRRDQPRPPPRRARHRRCRSAARASGSGDWRAGFRTRRDPC